MRRYIVVVGVLVVLGAGVAIAQNSDPALDFEARWGQALLKRDADELKAQSKRASDAVRQAEARTADEESSTQETKIVNGVPTYRHPSVGALVKVDGNGRLTRWCTGTMIGCSTFVTAQHCIAEDQNPDHYRVFLQHAGIQKLTSIAPAPGYDFPVADLAVLKLAAPITGVEPTPVLKTAVADNSPGLIVGFGRTGGMRDDGGMKRLGGITTEACHTNYDNSRLVCWNYTDPVGAPGQRSNTCNGDSGGPMLITGANGRTSLAGVTSGGMVRSCLQGDHSYDVNVPLYSDWILAQAGQDAKQLSCGLGPQAFGKGSRVQGDGGTLNAAATSKVFVKAIQASAKTIRVAMHGVDNDTNDFEWLVELRRVDGKAVGQPCKPTTGQFAYCEFKGAGAGQVQVTAKRRAGAGDFQVIVTELD